MEYSRSRAAFNVLKGFLAAVLVTLALMAALAALVVYAALPDSWLRGLNQGVKVLSIITGTCLAVGRGGRQGFVTGMLLSMLYMIAGYGLYLLLGGGVFDPAGMLGEILIGAALGGAAGAVLANLSPRRRAHG